MKLWRIEFNEVGYDQYDSFLVCAETKERAIELLKEINYSSVPWEGGFDVVEERMEVEEIIHSSFNAG